MKAQDIYQHFADIVKQWVDPAESVDRIIAGSPDKEISSVGVTWMSTWDKCREALDAGMDMLITHEPTFFDHFNEQDNIPNWDVAQKKKAWLDEKGLVILRIHDCWDKFPDTGIPFAWARFLGIQGKPVKITANRMQHRYDIPETTVGELARSFALKTAMVGEPNLQVIADKDRTVSKIGIGTGCACRIGVFQDMGCDCAVVTDDGSLYWRDISRTLDEGFPVIRVNHGTSEEPGMITLTGYVKNTFPALNIRHLTHRCWYTS